MSHHDVSTISTVSAAESEDRGFKTSGKKRNLKIRHISFIRGIFVTDTHHEFISASNHSQLKIHLLVKNGFSLVYKRKGAEI